MLIEIRKASFENKGAELMLNAALQQMKAYYPDADFAMPPYPTAPFKKRAALGLYQKFAFYRKGIPFNSIGNLIPKKLRDNFGIVVDKEIDIVLDAAGFSYTDQWGPAKTIELANSCKRFKKNGSKVILLPQAFGPFNSQSIKKAIKIAIDNADLVFAREKISYDYLVSVVGERSNLKIAPDFTNLVDGVLPQDFDVEKNRFCLIPNYRMIDKSSKDISEAYIPFMITCAKYLIKHDTKPFILVHEGENDLLLAKKINASLGDVLPIIQETDPFKIKGILGACDATLGSRFHGLVSALSQGVPSLATGWSHKYQMLFDDYDFHEGIIDVMCSDQNIHSKLDLLINPTSQKIIKQKLKQKSDILKKQTVEMWQEVFSKLG